MSNRNRKRRLQRGIMNQARELFQAQFSVDCSGLRPKLSPITRMTALESLNALCSNNRAAEAAAQASKTRRT